MLEFRLIAVRGLHDQSAIYSSSSWNWPAPVRFHQPRTGARTSFGPQRDVIAICSVIPLPGPTRGYSFRWCDSIFPSFALYLAESTLHTHWADHHHHHAVYAFRWRSFVGCQRVYNQLYPGSCRYASALHWFGSGGRKGTQQIGHSKTESVLFVASGHWPVVILWSECISNLKVASTLVELKC